MFVNEFKVQEQRLKHGDVVQFGGAADIPVGTRFGGTESRIRCSARRYILVTLQQNSSKLPYQNLQVFMFCNCFQARVVTAAKHVPPAYVFMSSLFLSTTGHLP